MSGIDLVHRHIFGYKTDVRNSLHWIEDTKILYPAGNCLVVYDLESKTQQFMYGSDVQGQTPRAEINALAISHNKNYVAVATSERSSDRATVNIWDLRTFKKRKTLSFEDTKSREWVSLSFAPDNEGCIIALGGAPDWSLVAWDWTTNKPLASLNIDTKNQPAYQCSFCPEDPAVLCVTGKGFLSYYRLDEGASAFKIVEPTLYDRESEDYTCHAFTRGAKLVVGSREGNLLLLEDTVFRGELPASSSSHGGLLLPSGGHHSSSSSSSSSTGGGGARHRGRAIECLVPYIKGFVAGCDEGVVKIYEEGSREQYVLSKTLHVDGQPVRVRAMAVSPTHEHLAVSLDNNQTYVLRMFTAEGVKAEEMHFEALIQPNHTGPVTGLDTCVRKPIIVTCGTDKTIRVWNYLTRTLELCVQFPEQAHSISLHPSGLHLLVGFTDKLRLMNILMDDIRTYKEFPIKACSECAFSNGGQAFAAVHAGLIQIYSTYTCEQLAVFRGHTGLVKSLYWSLDDSSIVSAGVDGAVYERKLTQSSRAQEFAQKVQEYVQKGCKFTSAIITEDHKIYAVGDDRLLKEIFERNVTRTVEGKGVAMTTLAISHPPQRMLFAGTAAGTIRSFKYPVTGYWDEYACHSKPVTRLRLTHDDAYLFSISDDGCLVIMEVQETDSKARHRDRTDLIPFAEEVLVTKSDLEEHSTNMHELKSKVEELTASNDYQIRVNDMKYQEALKRLTEKYTQRMEADRSKIETLRDEKQELELEFEEKINNLNKGHSTKLHAQDLEYQRAIMREVSKYQQLEETMEEDGREFERKARDRDDMHRREMQGIRDEFEAQLQDQHRACDGLSQAKDLVRREFEETVKQLEEDHDKEIELLKDKYETKLYSERDATLRLKGENGLMTKKFAGLKREIDDLEETKKQMTEKEFQLDNTIKTLKAQIDRHKAEIDERDVTIGEKERKIYDLKKDNQELEKFKFVLDFQIKELKRQIEPREKQIGEMKDKVMTMDGDLERFHKENGSSSVDVSELKEKLKEKQDAIRTQRQQYRHVASELESLANDLQQLVEFIQDPVKLKERTVAMHQRHVREAIQTTEVQPDVAKEYKRQKQFLEHSVDSVKGALQRDQKTHRNENLRMVQENVALIKEINRYRRELRLMHQVQRAKEMNGGAPVASSPSPTSGRRGRSMELEGSSPVAARSFGGTGSLYAAGDDFDEAEVVKTIELQRQQISQLRHQIEEAQARVVHARPVSRERLQPIDEYTRTH